MKKVFVLIFIVFIVLVGIWLANSYHAHNYPKMGPDAIYYPDLFVGEYTIVDKNVVLFVQDGIPIAELPFTKLLEGLGISVTWTEPYTANFSIDHQQYTLSLQDYSICRTGEEKNLIVHGNGIYAIDCLVFEDSQELYLDNYSCVTTLAKIGFSIWINWDSSQNSVVVTEGKGQGNLDSAKSSMQYIKEIQGDVPFVSSDPAQLNP